MLKQVSVQLTELVVSTAKQPYIRLNLGEKHVDLPVSDDVRKRFIAEFLGDKLTARQKKRLTTVMTLLREAYLQGRRDSRVY